ncbi:phosphate acetyltransferase [archaeon]|nr:phosphate acetyltransferase [archaeon]|tara:strand:+ start:1990 stop:2796 length:807 start_codon:yes stop_codon:yes gene_type:complete
MDLIAQIKKKAVKAPARIIFCENNDNRIASAVNKIKKEKTATPILLDGKTLEDNFKTAVNMLENDEADAIISGASHPTAMTIKLAISHGTQDGVQRISGGMLMLKQQSLYYFADCAVMIDPDAKQLAEVATLSSQMFQKITGLRPRVAMLSYSTLGSAQGDSAQKVRQAIQSLKKTNFEVLGEVQVDAAIDPAVLHKKAKVTSTPANVFVFPDLDAGNIGYKLVQRLGEYRAIGPILHGTKKPINDLSRGCTVSDIVDLSAVTSIQAK